jgi:hypothetical protein
VGEDGGSKRPALRTGADWEGNDIIDATDAREPANRLSGPK